MKVKYTITVNNITAELEFEDYSAIKDSEYLRHEIEAQYKMLSKVNQKESDSLYKTDLLTQIWTEALDKALKKVDKE